MGSGAYPYSQNSSQVIMVFMKLGSLFVESGMFCVYGYDPETKSFRHFSHNENPTRAVNTISLKCRLPSTDAIDMREQNSSMRMKVQGRLMQAHFTEIHEDFANRIRSDIFLTKE